MSQPPRIQTNPATLAAILRDKIDPHQSDPAIEAYVQHWDTCKRGCRTARDANGMCPTGRHLYYKQAFGGANHG